MISSTSAAAAGIAGVEIAGPGFLNITLETAAAGALVGQIVAAGAALRRAGDALAGKQVNLEFVSANPTGPVHIGGARWAAVGDALGRMLSTQGAEVVREYYFNDAGAQIDRFARSLLAAARGLPAPEDGYGGDYIGEIAGADHRRAPGRAGAAGRARPPSSTGTQGVELMFDEIKATLHLFRTDFDVYFHENSLHESGAVDRGGAAAQGFRPPDVRRRRLVAELHRLRRRQGPGGHQVRRRARLHRRRPGLLPGQARPAASTCASTCSAPTTTATSPG